MYSPKDTVFPRKSTINCRGRLVDLSTPKVMAIVNITPDSFYDGGKIKSDKDLLNQVELHLSSGATFIDIGAVSSRPGSIQIPEEQETKRLENVINSITTHFTNSLISIDSYRFSVMKSSIELGASLINDISCGHSSPDIISECVKHDVPFIGMHHHITPHNHEELIEPEKLEDHYLRFFDERFQTFRKAGLKDFIIDPGFGFGKTMESNYRLLDKMNQLNAFNLPILAGISRKRMVHQVLGTDAQKALNGTTALNMLALKNGTNILRVHDVKEAMECIELFNYYKESNND